jgi:bisphosphoglycerate-dependent phosphoglycerate mutase
MAAHRIGIDIICLSEHWLGEEEVSSTTIQGYEIGNYYCRSKRRNGGVIIYVKTGISVRPLLSVDSLSTELHAECTSILVESLTMQTTVVNVYRAPSGIIDVFYDTVTKILSVTSLKKGRIIIGGDINVDFMSEGSLKNRLMDLITSSGMTNIIDQPTRVTVTSATCIDNVFTNVNKDDICVDVIDLGISDHHALIVRLKNIETTQIAFDAVYKRSFSEHKKEEFNYQLSKIQWNTVIQSTTVDEMFGEFMETFKKSFDGAFPRVKKKPQNVQKTRGLKWFTPELKTRSKDVQRAYAESKRKPHDLDAKSTYNRMKKIYASEIKEAKRKLNNQIISTAKNKVKAAWSVIKSNNNESSQKPNSDLKIKLETGTISEQQEVAELFSDYYKSLVPKLLKTRPPAPARLPETTRMHDNIIFLTPLTTSELYNIILDTCNKHSAGFDEVPGDVIKRAALYICEPLTQIINESLSQGRFPTALKKAVVIPIHKKGDKEIIDNYRPISLLSGFSKIFERAMSIRLLSFLRKYSLQNECQHGFTQHKSTTTAISGFVNDVLETLDFGEEALGIFYDYSKAFDTINHALLKEKLRKLGIAGVANEWINSFLLDRKQVIGIRGANNTYYSKETTINVGLPQGSTLSPLLFILYTNDLPEHLGLGKLTLFADDTTHFIKAIKNETKLTTVGNEAVKRMVDYCESNDLFINIDKTLGIQFTTKFRKITEPVQMELKGNKIPMVEETVFLGLSIDSELNWGTHTDKLAKKIAAGCFLIKKIMEISTLSTALTLYYGYIQARLQYGIILWGSTRHAQRIFVLQKRAVKYLAGASFNPCAEVFYKDTCITHFRNLEILTLPCLYIFYVILYARDQDSLKKQDNIPCTVRSTRARAVGDPRPQQTKVRLRSTIKQHTIQAGIRLNNALPKSLRTITGKVFKCKLKSFLIEKCFYSIKDFCPDF